MRAKEKKGEGVREKRLRREEREVTLDERRVALGLWRLALPCRKP